MMRIAVVGAGGVGGFFGGRLARSGVDTTFIARSNTLDALRTRGLRVDSIEGDFELPQVRVTDDPASIGQVDAVLVTVKAWQIPEIAPSLLPLLSAETAVIPLENGVDAPEALARFLPASNVLGGLCAIVSAAAAPGHIVHSGIQPVVMLGELDNHVSERVERLVAAFRNAGINAEAPRDIHRSMWTKFLFIAPMSAIGALTRVPAGVWRTMPEVRAMADASLREVVAVAKARGIDLGDDAIEKTWQRYDALPATATSSMQRDVMEGKPSELDAQLGAVVRLGRDLRVPTPVSEMIHAALLPQERTARGALA